MNATPTIVVLKEGTDTSQGIGQTISNINACIAVQDTLKSTLGPYGSDILMVDSQGHSLITNDGATILHKLDIVHPAAQVLVDISKSQDVEIGDGTTSVCLVGCEILKLCRGFVEEGMSGNVISKGLRDALTFTLAELDLLKINVEKEDVGKEVALTCMNSKVVKNNGTFFADVVVKAVEVTNGDETMIGIKKVPGGGMGESLLIDGVAFKKTFSYAGFEQMPKRFENAKVLSLNLELELKAEKDNAEVRVDKVEDYQKIVDAEYKIIIEKLDQIVNSGINIVLSKLPIGDLATQYFASKNIFCAGRVSDEDLKRTVMAVGGNVLTSVSDIQANDLGHCDLFQERQIGNERYNLFTGCPQAKTCTIILRGGSLKIIDEIDRSLHDAIMVVKRTRQSKSIVAGGGAIEMELSKRLRDYSHTIRGKRQLIVQAFAKALEVIPKQLCENAGLDTVEVLNQLRNCHARGDIWAGVDVDNDGVCDCLKKFVWEPSVVKGNLLSSAVEAACLILSVDETIRNKSEEGGRGRGVPV
ncbi:chaperonin-containing T-complex subunit [Martiniozyma asiatica (nom. inval.)]|nr:chaperonin-containing T-complex subunit [Martiniozyma asiatica]